MESSFNENITSASVKQCTFAATAGHSTMDSRDEYLELYYPYYHHYHPTTGESSSSLATLPSSSLQADLDTDQPLYFWQLYSLMGSQPILDICHDFYEFVFADNQEYDWFRSVFERSASEQHHVQTQSTYWIDAMGGGPVYQGGLGRLNFHHHSSDARSIMTAKGARRWMYHMRASVRKNHFHFERLNDDRILPCLVAFLETKMASYAKKFQWDLDPIDFELQDFYPSGKTIPERYRQERRRKPQLDQVSRAMPTSSSSSSSSNAMKKKKETVVKSSDKSRGDHNKRLIGWNVDLLERMLRQIQAHRQAEGVAVTSLDNFVIHQRQTIANTIDPRNNICKIIPFPPFDKKESIRIVNPNTIELDPNVRAQLAEYVTFIASHYRHELAYHNFNHASNVATFANKLLQRIVDESLTRSLTHPLVQFSVILAALIHDMDHVGESQVFKNTIVDLYDGKSVAEQNSIDKAWSELMDPSKYQQLRMAICANPTESQRFRNLLVNMVMATDMFDEELILDRDTRWKLAFGDHSTENSNTSQGDEALGEDDNDDKNGIRSTILVEHILQASNIGHAMQPLHGFKRWNERLFLESWQVLADSNPSEQNALISQWYENQLRFFDNYVIPLAARLNNCGMFGNAGADLLACAQSNRKEWEEKGEKVVREFATNITNKELLKRE